MKDIYKKEKINGVFYTPYNMANYLSEQMIKYSCIDMNDTIFILDPAVGNGVLLISMINNLKKYNKNIVAVGYEIDKYIAEKTYQILINLFPNVKFDIRVGDFLEAVENGIIGEYDFVIANPPYVRTQIIGSDKSKIIANKLALTGRIDIYYAFLLYTKKVLRKSGIAGYITSNKFMTIKAGASVRNYMIDNYKIHRIIDFGDTKFFVASVLPCIIIFSNGKTNNAKDVYFTSVYQQQNKIENILKINEIFDVIEKEGNYSISDGRIFNFQQGTLNSISKNTLWRLSSNENFQWLSKVSKKTWMLFSQIGKIHVGIKTTADNVFIGDKWIGSLSELELLKPLITHRNSGQIIPNTNVTWKVLYTHQMKNGKKIPYDINDYPKTKAYLMDNFEQLASRKYVQKANRKWYEIWVPQNPDAWQHKKIVFRDISEKPEFWIDTSGAVVNGDCYWIDIYPNIKEDLIYLALAVANSSFIEKFYDIKFNTKLYSGKRRYQAQYVEQFPIPYYGTDEAKIVIAIVKKIIAEGNQETVFSYKQQINSLVEYMFS